MKCKECNVVNCSWRTTDAEKECQFQTSMIQILDEWQGVRIQAAIAAMQGLISNGFANRDLVDSNTTRECLAKTSAKIANALVEELKKK